jgi:hypothetical protein
MPNGYGQDGYGEGGYGSPPAESLDINYYLGLITSEYQGSPNYLSWVRTLLQTLDDVSTCLHTLTDAFDLDTAVGAQLDILGVIVGQGRNMTFQPSGGGSPILDDMTYRLLLKACIARNQWDGTVDGLKTVWANLFPGGKIIVSDGQNMSCTLVMSGSFTSIATDLINNGLIVPRPEGVLYNYTFATLPVFGFDENNANISGFDLGKWS